MARAFALAAESAAAGSSRCGLGVSSDRGGDEELAPYLLKLQQHLLELVFQGEGLPRVLQEIGLAAEELFQTPFFEVRIGDGASPCEHRACRLPSGIEDYLQAARRAGNLPGAPALGDEVIIEDTYDGDSWPLFRAWLIAAGVRAWCCEPIRARNGNPCGALELFFLNERSFGSFERRALRGIASLLGFIAAAIPQQEAARAANQRFSDLVSAIPGVVYQRVVSPDGDIRYTYVSDGAKDLFGVAPEEILADPESLFRYHGPEYKAKFRERLIAASKSLSMWDVEASLVTPDGRKKYTHAMARPTLQADGSVLWTGLVLDETRTREAIIDSLSQGFLVYDQHDRLILCNAHYLDLYPSLKGIAVPGATYLEVALAEIQSWNATSDKARDDGTLQDRLSGHAQPKHMFEQILAGDRCVLVSEQRTAEGGTVVLYSDITELRRRDREIQHLAYHDALTQLPNRRLFRERVDTALAHAEQTGKPCAIVCLDVDHFKHVNDTLGHDAGDALLQMIAERLRSVLKEDDTVARLGGDEFGIVVSCRDRLDDFEVLARRIIRDIARPLTLAGQQVATGVSLGIATSTGEEPGPEQLLKQADLALYRAKVDGRGTFRFFEPNMDARAQERRGLELDLRQALTKEDELAVYYQPQVDVGTGRLTGFEALVRWHHPKRGFMPPCDFIPFAEETGLILRLGEWVLRRACFDAAKWPSSIRVAVNVSPAQFKNRDLPETVARVLGETGLAPERLELEITETLLVQDFKETLAALEMLKALGIRISMDDFGTGYSSLANLRSFPFDKIKIDQSFVREMETDSEAAAIVRAVLGLGQSLRIRTCAEGVETPDQIASLRREGCTEVQGYLYGKPQPLADAIKLIERWPTADA